MTALQELRAGALGEAFVKLLYRQVAVVAKAHRYPQPEGHSSWTVDAVQETAHNFLVDGGHKDLIEMAARVDNDPALERLLATMVRNHLRKRGRRTTLGKLIIRLKSVLAEDDQFSVISSGIPGAGYYTLHNGPTDPFNGRTDSLEAAAQSVIDVTVVRWSPTARREGPVADAASLKALCAAVLGAANGSVDIVTLANVIADRLGIDPRGVPAALAVEDIDDLTSHGYGVTVGTAAPDDATGSRIELDEITESILEQLTAREKLVLACLHETVRVIANQTGLRVSTAGSIKQRVTAKLHTILARLDETEGEAIAIAARDAARKEVGFDPV
jgi:hypothetical protein